MDAVGRKIENQVQFWSLLGPSLVLLSIAVLLFKVSVHWYIPVSALIGIPLCVKWKMKGMAAALGCLLLLTGLGYQNLELDDRYWHVGLALTMAFSFIVLTLSLEEVQNLVNKLKLESQSRLDNFALLDEKWKIAEQEWSHEREKSQVEIAALAQDLTKTQEDKQIFYKLAQLAKDELVQVRSQHEQLLQELFYKKQQIAQLYERLEETEMTIQEFVNSDAEKHIQSLTERLTGLEKEKEMLKAKASLLQAEELNWQKDKMRILEDLQACQEREQQSIQERQRLQQEKIEQQNALQTLQKRCQHLEQEKSTILDAKSQLQQQFEHMRCVDAQHRQLIQQLQHRMQDLESREMAEEKQKQSLQRIKNELEEQLIHQEKNFKQREEHYQAALHQLQEQLKEQEEKQQTEQHQELQLMQERYAQAQADLAYTQEALHTISDALKQAQQLQKDLIKQKEDLEMQLVRVQQQTEQQYQQKQELLSINALYEKNQRELLDCQQQLEAKNKALVEVQEKLDKLMPASVLEKDLQVSYSSDIAAKRVQAMYAQLRQQFEEKCETLNATRRELFHVNEKLLRLQKEHEEEQLADLSDNEAHLHCHLLKLEQHDREHQQEVEELMLLIEHLFQQMSAMQSEEKAVTQSASQKH